MSRNAQVTRQWLFLQQLEHPRGLTLPELAAVLPEEYVCHPRTIRRDLEALEVRFPLITERVGGHTRWRLIDGFRNVPALQFSPTELMALVFSRELLKPLDGTEFKAALDSVFNKATAALPADGIGYVKQMQGYFSVGLGPHKTYREHRKTIEQITRSIEQTRTVQMRYYAASHDTASRREVDPYRLWYMSGALYLIAYCHLRHDVRLFAVDRIRSLIMTNRPCQMPLGFDLETYVQHALVVMRGQPIELELLFDRPTTTWVEDRQWHPSQRVSMGKDRRLTMTLNVADTPELVGWILSFGHGVRIMRPGSLREKIMAKAREILEQQ